MHRGKRQRSMTVQIGHIIRRSRKLRILRAFATHRTFLRHVQRYHIAELSETVTDQDVLKSLRKCDTPGDTKHR